MKAEQEQAPQDPSSNEKQQTRRPHSLTRIVLLAAGVSVLVDFTLDLLAPSDSVAFTTSVKLVDVVLSTNGGDLTAALAPSLPTRLQRLSLPLGEHDVPGCPLAEIGSATIDVTPKDPKQALQVDRVALRSTEGCSAFRLTTKRDPAEKIGLLLSPRRRCGLSAGVELAGEQVVRIKVTYSRGTEIPAGCTPEQDLPLRDLAPRALDPESALVLYRTDGEGHARDTQVKIVANALEGTTTVANALFGQAVQKAETHCAYGRNTRLKIAGQIAISYLAVGADGLALDLHADAHDVGIDDTRDCLREINGGVAPSRGRNRVVAIIRGVGRSTRDLAGCAQK